MLLPTISDPLQKFQGEIKKENSSFQVEEIPLYPPSGEGQHLYLQITKSGINTQDLITKLSKLFSIPKKAIGCAGLKDRNAITTQWLSLDLGRNFDITYTKQKIETEIPHTTVDQLSWHANKIRTGHLKGNHFKILIYTSDPDALAKAKSVVDLIHRKGFPNFYGHQRFGSKGDNAIRGKEILLHNLNSGHHKKKFLLSAYQSLLFNMWLTKRISDGLFDKIISGDIIINLETGKPTGNLSIDEQQVSPKQSYSGPIFGKRMLESDHYSKRIEQEVLKRENITPEHFSTSGLLGSRRAGVVFPSRLELDKTEDGIWLDFSLPKGSYATTLIDQFVRKG